MDRFLIIATVCATAMFVVPLLLATSKPHGKHRRPIFYPDGSWI